MPDSDGGDGGDEETLYVVTAYEADALQPTTFNVAAPTPEEAESRVLEQEGVEEVLSELTSPFTGTFKLELSGSPDDVGNALEQFDALCAHVDATATIEDVTATVWPVGESLDDEEAVNVAVSDWGDLQLRVIGNDIEGGGDIISMTPASVEAHGDTTVEVVAGDRVLARVVRTGAGLPAPQPDDETAGETG